MTGDDETVYDGGTTSRGDMTISADATVASDATHYDRNATAFAEPVSNDDVAIEKGVTLLGLYQVQSDAIAGGMGKVWRVRHTGWNADLAMKQPKSDLFQNQRDKENFIRECEAWIDLGLHPHIVSCYYVREIGGIPSIFAEWMGGGSLKNWIESGRLYEGDARDVLKLVLDIAIQFARGLHYAHERELVHQDVKPDNLLLTPEGEAKVADFGLARARAALTVSVGAHDGTIMVAGGGYTPAYCSPEQIGGDKLTRRTDIWSWAVSVLEMFLGEHPWQSGVAAGMACDVYFDMEMRVAMPEGMKRLLSHCFKEEQSERPHDFTEIEKVLLGIYKAETGSAYPRRPTKAAADTADSLNNRALSMLDLGKREDAERFWERALKITPDHTESMFNQGVHLWKTARTDDTEVLRRLSESLSQKTDYYLAKIHLARGDAESALACLHKAKRALEAAEDIETMLAEAREWITNDRDGKCLRTFGKGYIDLKSVSFSSDGRRALSGGLGGVVKLWDVATGECLRMFDSASLVSFSTDDRTALLVSTYCELYEVATGECLRTFEKHSGSIESISFSPDGRTALWGSVDKTLQLSDVATGKCLRTFTGHGDWVNSVCFSPDGRTALSGSKDRTMKLWEVATGECLRTFTGHGDWVNSVCFSPDGQTALTGSHDRDKTLKLWDATTGECLRTFGGHSASIGAVCFSPDGRTALSGSGKEGYERGEGYGELKLWNVATGECLRTFIKGHSSSVISVSFCPDGRTALAGSRDSAIKLWRLPETRSCEMELSKVTATAKTLQEKARFDSLTSDVRLKMEKNDVAAALPLLAAMAEVPQFGKSAEYYAQKNTVASYCVLEAVCRSQ